jgi:hypothetical protein
MVRGCVKGGLVMFVLLGSPDQIGFFVDVGKEGKKKGEQQAHPEC